MEDTSSNLMVEVQIPENSVPGDKITVQCPDSNYIQFVTPENVVPGDTIRVVVGDIEASGEEISNQNENVAETVVPSSKDGGSVQGAVAVTTVRNCAHEKHVNFYLSYFPFIYISLLCFRVCW